MISWLCEGVRRGIGEISDILEEVSYLGNHLSGQWGATPKATTLRESTAPKAIVVPRPYTVVFYLTFIAFKDT